MTNDIKVVQLGRGVHSYYVYKVKGNHFNSPELTALKLTRNILLAKEVNRMDNIRTYSYGCLYITYDILNKTVLSVENVWDEKRFFNKDKEKYDELNVLLGINELEQRCLEEYKQRKQWALTLTISQSTIDYFRKRVAKDNSVTDSTIVYKIKSQIIAGHKLTQFEDQKEKGRQYYRNGKLLFCVKDNVEVVHVRWAAKKKYKDLQDIA
jgi:hypothetical protein